MSRFGLRLLAASVLVLAAIVACSSEPGAGAPVVDGYPLGDIATCEGGCQRFVDAASEWLDLALPGHALVVAAEVRRLGVDILFTRSGSNGDFVVVLRLDDGSTRAIFVMCGVGIDPDRCSTMPADVLRQYLRS